MTFTRWDVDQVTDKETSKRMCQILLTTSKEHGLEIRYNDTINRGKKNKTRVQYRKYDMQEALDYFADPKIREGTTRKMNTTRDIFIKILKKIKKDKQCTESQVASQQ